jgi:imidazolonepropionase
MADTAGSRRGRTPTTPGVARCAAVLLMVAAVIVPFQAMPPPRPLIIRNARVVTPVAPARDAPGGYLRGEALGELSVNPAAEVHIQEATIVSVRGVRGSRSAAQAPATPSEPLPPARITETSRGIELDAGGRALIPGFVDAHTHACWAGSRIDEWELKRKGVPYLEILRRGGGIMATVRAVREASRRVLTDLLLERLMVMLEHGTTTVEVKSGYGLSTEHELKMLHAIADAATRFPGTIVPTALLGHAIDEAMPGFVGRTVRETLPAVAAEFPGIAVDAYCEQGAWSVEQCVLLFTRARELGLPIRVHADQFNDLGMIDVALKLGARSVDHLEASKKTSLAALARSPAAGVMLPACGFHLDQRYARGRAFVVEGGAPCLATNANPGSAPCLSMPFVIALAVRHLGLSPAEALAATTCNPARLLGLHDRGTIDKGQRADLVLLDHPDERITAYAFGQNPVHAVIVGGRLVAGPLSRSAAFSV